MESEENEDLERQIQQLEQKKRDLQKKKLIKRVKDLENEVNTMELSGQTSEDSLCRTDLTEQDTDISRRPTRSAPQTSPDEQIKRLRVMFESVEEMLRPPDYDEDLQSELSAACPNYMTVLLTAKRDLLRNDCGIVVTETSAGKTTLINQLVRKRVFATSNLAATGTITRIRDSEKMEIKCYLKDETLKKEEEVQDVKKLRSIIKGFTDISKIPEDLKDIYYVDVFLPVPILKGNVIIVDTPGIGENEKLDNILLDFLPHAVSFVFIVNAKNAGGIHEDRLSKIMTTIMSHREKMPCFDPREVMFLTNQWDIIDNEEPSSDEDNGGESDKEDQHTLTWKLILSKLTNIWSGLNVEKVFRISLKQVEKGVDNFFTDEYKRFEVILKKTIAKNENKRVEFYYRFLKDFIRNAERGTLARLQLLDRSEEEQRRIIGQSNDKIRDLESKCKQTRMELESYKIKIIPMLAEKLHTYLHSSCGREEILNPPSLTRISDVKYTSLGNEVPSRVKRGIQRWCEGKEVKTVIEDADKKIRSRVKDIESKLMEIEFEMTGLNTTVDNSPSGAAIIGLGLGLLFLPFSVVFTFVFALVFAPIFLAWGWFIGAEGRRQKANDIYDDCLRKISMSELEASFQQSFGVEYGKIIVRIFDETLPKIIESLRKTNQRLLDEHKAIKQKRESFMRLKEKIQKIQVATKNFEINF